MPDLLGRREIDLPQAGPKTNELIAKHVHTRGFNLFSFIQVSRNISYDRAVKKTRTAVARLHLVRSPRFILSPCFIPSP